MSLVVSQIPLLWGGVNSSAPAEFSQSWKFGWPFLQEQGLFFIVLNPLFTVLVSYRRDMVFKLFLRVLSCPGGFFFRWKSTWEGWGTSCSSTQGRCDEASVTGALGGTIKPSNAAPVPPRSIALFAPLCLLHLLSWRMSSQGSNSCSHHCYQDQSSSRNFVIPPHSLNSLPSHSSGFSPKKSWIIQCSKATSMVWPEKGQTMHSHFN